MIVEQSKTPQRLRFIREVQSLNFGYGLRFNWKLVWLVFAVLIIFFLERKGVKAKDPAAVAMIPLGVLGLYFLLVHWEWADGGKSAPLTKGYRLGSQKARNFAGTNRYRSDQAFIGSDRTARKMKKMALLGRVDLIGHPMGYDRTTHRPRVLGLWRDHRYATWTTCLGVAFSSLYGVDEDERQRRMKNFASLLDNIAEHGRIHRFGFKIQSIIGEYQDPEALIRHIRRGSALSDEEAPNQEVLVRQMGEMSRSSVKQKVMFTFTFHDRDFRREAKLAGGYPAAIAQELDSLYALVMGRSDRGHRGRSPIGATNAAWLSHNNLALSNLMMTDYFNGHPAWSEWLGRKRADTELFQEWEAWPYSADFQSSPQYGRVGDTFIRTYFANRFTTSGMADDQLWPLISLDIPKTISIIFRMVPFEKAQTHAEWGASAAEEATRGTHRLDAATDVAREEAQRHEQEIARAIGETGRPQLFVTTYSRSPEEVDAHHRQLERAWTSSRIRLVPMTDDQPRGFEALLSIGRGAPSTTD